MDGEHGFPWVFRYIEEPRHPGSLFRDRPLLRPAVPVTFIGPDGPQQVFALVDSGADHILAAPWIAQAVGIDLHQAPEEPLKVAGGSHQVKFVNCRLELSPPTGTVGAPVQWEAQIGFFDKWPVWPSGPCTWRAPGPGNGAGNMLGNIGWRPEASAFRTRRRLALPG